jgi:hypothetical protein
MTNKDYALIAKAVREATLAMQRHPRLGRVPPRAQVVINDCIANALIFASANDNPRFNSVKFREACDV